MQRGAETRTVFYKTKVDAKNRLEDYCFTARNFHTEEKLKGKFEAGHNEKSGHDASDQVDKSRLVEKDEFEAKQKELEGVDRVVKQNVEIVELKDDEGDIANGTESHVDDVAKIERDKASEAKTDAVAENKNSEVPQECNSKADVEQAAATSSQQRRSRCSRPRRRGVYSATNR